MVVMLHKVAMNTGLGNTEQLLLGETQDLVPVSSGHNTVINQSINNLFLNVCFYLKTLYLIYNTD